MDKIGNGQAFQHDRCGQITWHIIRQFDNIGSVNHPVACIGAIGKRIANPVADSQTFDITANRFDDTSTFRPENEITINRPWIGTIADINIEKINANRVMFDQHFTRCGG